MNAQAIQIETLKSETNFGRFLDENFNEADFGTLIERFNEVTERHIKEVPEIAAPAIWNEVRANLLTPTHPPAVKDLLYKKSFEGWDEQKFGPRPMWTPTEEIIRNSNLQQVMDAQGLKTPEEMYRWSVEHGKQFWEAMMGRLGITFSSPYSKLVNTDDPKAPKWFEGAEVDVASIIFRGDPSRVAIVYQQEGGKIREVTYGELDKLSNKFANALRAKGVQKGEAIALDVTQGLEWVVSMIGAAKAGCPVWSIPNTFKGSQLDLRFDQMPEGVKLVVTQDVTRDAAKHPVYDNVVASKKAPPVAVVAMGEGGGVKLSREQDISWLSFLEDMSEEFKAEKLKSDHPFVVHFSSGTSNAAGQEKPPKAIAWKFDTLVKSAVDTHLHRDMHPEDRLLWTTGPGWMMGSTVLWGALLNQGSMAIYDGNYTKEGFADFIDKSKATILGTVPSAVKPWVQSRCMEDKFNNVRLLCSTAEPSTPADQFYLASLKQGFLPIIEGMGGTEIGGGYLSATLHRPCTPSMFNAFCFGTEVKVAGQDGFQHPEFEEGEIGLVMHNGGDRTPPMGLSTRFENRSEIYDHSKLYFGRGVVAGTGGYQPPVREHGDIVKLLPCGMIQSDGRAGDTCNINGIKVAFSSLERCIRDAHIPGLAEVAVTAVRPEQAGADIVCVLYSLEGGMEIPKDELKAKMLRAIKDQMPQWAKIDHLFEVEPQSIRPGAKISSKTVRAHAEELVRHMRATQSVEELHDSRGTRPEGAER